MQSHQIPVRLDQCLHNKRESYRLEIRRLHKTCLLASKRKQLQQQLSLEHHYSIPDLLQALIQSDSRDKTIQALMMLGNFLGDPAPFGDFASAIQLNQLQKNLFDSLIQFIKGQDLHISQMALFTLSNFVGDSSFNCAQLAKPLLDVLSTERQMRGGDFEIAEIQQIAWIYCNLLNHMGYSSTKLQDQHLSEILRFMTSYLSLQGYNSYEDPAKALELTVYTLKKLFESTFKEQPHSNNNSKYQKMMQIQFGYILHNIYECIIPEIDIEERKLAAQIVSFIKETYSVIFRELSKKTIERLITNTIPLLNAIHNQLKCDSYKVLSIIAALTPQYIQTLLIQLGSRLSLKLSSEQMVVKSQILNLISTIIRQDRNRIQSLFQQTRLIGVLTKCSQWQDPEIQAKTLQLVLEYCNASCCKVHVLEEFRVFERVEAIYNSQNTSSGISQVCEDILALKDRFQKQGY